MHEWSERSMSHTHNASLYEEIQNMLLQAA